MFMWCGGGGSGGVGCEAIASSSLPSRRGSSSIISFDGTDGRNGGRAEGADGRKGRTDGRREDQRGTKGGRAGRKGLWDFCSESTTIFIAFDEKTRQCNDVHRF